MNTVQQRTNHENKMMTSAFLKWLAMGTMLVDHLGAIIIEPWLVRGGDIGSTFDWLGFDMILRSIGRLAFPIFCFLLVEGYFHTHDVKKYAIRLGLFALISEIPFNLGITQQLFSFDYQNVFFTLLAGLIAIWGLDQAKNAIAHIAIPALMAVAAIVLNTDYGAYGVIMIIILYWCHSNHKLQAIVGAIYNLGQLSAALAFIPIYFYNGQKGQANTKWLYWIYPIHILIYALVYRYFFMSS